jgi:hypothetical protein
MKKCIVFSFLILMLASSFMDNAASKHYQGMPFAQTVRQNNTYTLETSLSQNLANSDEGYSVSLSADGTTLAVGCPGNLLNPGWPNNFVGQTQIYVRSGTTWSLQATLSQQIEKSEEGYSVSLSADGNTLAVSAPTQGTVYIYTRSGITWSYQATLSETQANSFYGRSVCLAADGNTLAVGAPYYQTESAYDVGLTLMYVKSGTKWLLLTSLSQEITEAQEGWSVALSADGTMLAAGTPYYSYSNSLNVGGTQIYTLSGATWAHQATLGQGIPSTYEGASVALSANGTLLASGAPSWAPELLKAHKKIRLSPIGATQIYAQSGNSWAHQATLTQNTSDEEGRAIALSSDGTILAAANIIYAQSAGQWTYQESLKGSYDQFVALSSDGSTLSLGCPANNSTLVYSN